MFWNVAQLLKSTIGTERQYSLEEDAGLSELSSPVRGDLRMMRTDAGILVRLRAISSVRCECSRCLSDFSQPVNVELEEVFYPRVGSASVENRRLEKEEPDRVINEKHILDLSGPILQYALLDLPINPVCKDECKGLCSVCGTNRNEAPCKCVDSTADKRWARLDSIRTKLNS